MSGVPQLARDLPCAHCGYNLRGLPTDHRCPECGTPVANALEAAVQSLAGMPASSLEQLFRAVALDSGANVNAVLFIRDCVGYAIDLADGKHVGAAQICDGVCAYSREYFNDRTEALELLNEWGVRSSEDVGAIVFSLARHGLVVAGAEDRREDFAGRFRLATLFERNTDSSTDAELPRL